MLNISHSSRRNNGSKRPKVLCGPSALFSEGKVASTHHFCQSHPGPEKPLGLTSIITTLNPKVSYFSSCSRGWKAKFKSLFFLSRRPIFPVSKNQEHDFLLAGEWQTCQNLKPEHEIHSVILMTEFYYRITILLQSEFIIKFLKNVKQMSKSHAENKYVPKLL